MKPEMNYESISNHRQEDPKIPDRTDEEDASEQIMMTLSSLGKDEIHHPSVEQKA